MPKMIMVKAAPSLGSRVALSERHENHPGGEVFVAGQDSPPVEVAADTPEVTSALDQKRIVVLEGAALKQAQDVAKAAQERREALRASSLAVANPQQVDDAKVRQLEARVAKAEQTLTEATEKLDATIERQQAADTAAASTPPADAKK
jgi:sulfite reductase alpha subunit-like flavoprotein